MSIGKIIESLVQLASTDEPNSSLLMRSLTLDGRLSLSDALCSLSSGERYLVDAVLINHNGFSTTVATTKNVAISFRPHGRLHILPYDVHTRYEPHLTLLRSFALPSASVDRFHHLAKAEQTKLEECRHEVCEELDAIGFDAACDELVQAANHMAPLIHYVGDLCIANLYEVGKSSFEREKSFDEAVAEVLTQRHGAPIEQLVHVHSLLLALRSGGYTRLEELNSTQLSNDALNAFFDAKHSQYQAHLDCAMPSHFHALSLGEKARSLRDQRAALGEKRRFIRVISGANLRKREEILSLPPAAPLLSARRPDPDTAAVLGHALPDGNSIVDVLNKDRFHLLIEPTYLKSTRNDEFATCLEYAIDCIVDEAIAKTSSDFGMTRGVRHFARFADALTSEDAGLVSSWSQAEYFCHVVPNRAFRESWPPRSLTTILNAISGRMRYNSWHYAPSYFPESKIPATRYWFSAPRMADIADHSDQHHNGHVHTIVRYSIRSPLPIACRGISLPGFIDLRLMRQSGAPYSQSDLQTAIRYTECLQCLYQNLMDYVTRTGDPFGFSFGDKQWIDATYAQAGAPRKERQPSPAP